MSFVVFDRNTNAGVPATVSVRWDTASMSYAVNNVATTAAGAASFTSNNFANTASTWCTLTITAITSSSPGASVDPGAVLTNRLNW